MDSFLGILLMVAFIFGMAVIFKKRAAIASWLEEPTIAAESDIRTRRRYLVRKIEDAQFEIEKIDEILSNQKK